MIDRAGLADFLRGRRAALQPEDVGLPRGVRRRTTGLRREEAALLSNMSADYYARLERERGPQPSDQMLASIAQGLRLSLDERDHLFRLAGHEPPTRGAGSDHVGPGIMRILDRLVDTPAEIVTELGETLRQTPLAAALVGDASVRTGHARSIGYRWFTDPAARALHPVEEHAFLSRMYTSGLRHVLALRGPGSRAAVLAEDLLARSEEFRELWARHEVGVRPAEEKHYVHPEVGPLTLQCQVLQDTDRAQHLLVYTAEPGSESADRLRLLAVIGTTAAPPA
ncbi:transcriptional regulator with XRE-family HTH domain [Curtobacterium luteum]|uniref:Transcriptional regulator n=1 Tax=Curtobacterium luteum TaxID=33881 RepID=A0A8H9G7I8_9MICO|nr:MULTISPECIES: helix-turn-helix transcriptional regulator [Curtobacterium]MBM7802464.1 transcriptional regulator with XRE-family HTH domain [Curtobacterium luteum]NUU50472.1 helix-turn-helix domain-containing protein [Curtobacterium luteum]GGK93006.1 transcriptional regulator [Curtobacterium luteum]